MKHIKKFNEFLNENLNEGPAEVPVTKKQIFDSVWKLTTKSMAQEFIDELPNKRKYTFADLHPIFKKWEDDESSMKSKYSPDAIWRLNMALEDLYLSLEN